MQVSLSIRNMHVSFNGIPKSGKIPRIWENNGLIQVKSRILLSKSGIHSNQQEDFPPKTTNKKQTPKKLKHIPDVYQISINSGHRDLKNLFVRFPQKISAVHSKFKIQHTKKHIQLLNYSNLEELQSENMSFRNRCRSSKTLQNLVSSFHNQYCILINSEISLGKISVQIL